MGPQPGLQEHPGRKSISWWQTSVWRGQRQAALDSVVFIPVQPPG